MLRKSRLSVGPSASLILRTPCRTRLSKLSTSAEQTKEEGGNSPFPSNPRMIFVRPWDVPFTIAHVFGIVRDIEKRFGKIDDIIVPRDSDIPSTYAPYFIVKFAWEEDAQAIPPEGKVIQVPSPNVSEHRPGGIGLSDLEPYLNAAFQGQNLQLNGKDPESPFPDHGARDVKLMDVKLERARLQTAPHILDYSFKHRKRNPYFNKQTREAQDLALAIVNFGGFTNPPLPPNAPPSSFARIVNSWYNVMTPATRAKLMNQNQLAEQMNPHPSTSREIDSNTTFAADSNDFNDAILESTDEAVLIPESAPAMTSPSISGVEPLGQTAPSIPLFSSLSKQYETTPTSPSVPPSALAYSSPNTRDHVQVEATGRRDASGAPPVDSTRSKAAPKIQPPPRRSTSSEPQVPRMSKRERMLTAVREAAKADAMRTKALQANAKPIDAFSQYADTTPFQDINNVTTESTPTLNEPDSEPAPKPTSNWWSFLLGNNETGQRKV